MHITHNDSKRDNWDGVKSWNYQLPHLNPKMSVIYAEVIGSHGQVTSREVEWVYYIIDGNGEFIIKDKPTTVHTGDVITVPPKTPYNYKSLGPKPLKVVMFIDSAKD